MEINETYANVATELIEIFKYMDSNLINKIPNKLKEKLNIIANKEHKFYIDKSKTLKEQKMLPETECVLSAIYVKYLYPEQEEEIMQIWKQNTIKQEEENRKKYNPDNLFKNKHSVNEEQNVENNQLMVIEDNWYRKIILKIKGIVKKILGK